MFAQSDQFDVRPIRSVRWSPNQSSPGLIVSSMCAQSELAKFDSQLAVRPIRSVRCSPNQSSNSCTLCSRISTGAALKFDRQRSHLADTHVFFFFFFSHPIYYLRPSFLAPS
ncbi:unnamed protein product [Laminaria digitata]